MVDISKKFSCLTNFELTKRQLKDSELFKQISLKNDSEVI